MNIDDLEARLRGLAEVMERLGLGHYDREITARQDALGAVEEGVNDLVLDLQALHLGNSEKAAYLELQQRALAAKEEQLREQTEALAHHFATIQAQQVLLDERERELATMLATIRAQSESIRELTVPIIEVEDGIVALPVIGTIDAARAREIMETVLAHVVAHRSRHVILDLTGVGAIDTQTTDYLEKVVGGVRMLGARCIVCGLNPTTAQILVDLGANLASIQTFRSLKDGLRDSLRATGAARAHSR
jgi:rsbT co-antagonist protein RsbR